MFCGPRRMVGCICFTIFSVVEGKNFEGAVSALEDDVVDLAAQRLGLGAEVGVECLGKQNVHPEVTRGARKSCRRIHVRREVRCIDLVLRPDYPCSRTDERGSLPTSDPPTML